MDNKPHYHIAHQSLILNAELAGIKVQWMKLLGLAGLLGFNLTGGSPMNMAILVGILWVVKRFALQPIYDKDPLGIELFFLSVFFQDKFYQSHSDINSPGGTDNSSIPDIG